MTEIRPLDSPNFRSVLVPVGIERVPILGSTIHQIRIMAAFRPWFSHVFDQLKGRPSDLRIRWPDEATRLLASKIGKIAVQNHGWPCDSFVPDDPVEVVFQSLDDGLNYPQSILDIERLFGIRITDAEAEECWGSTFGELVELVADKGAS